MNKSAFLHLSYFTRIVKIYQKSIQNLSTDDLNRRLSEHYDPASMPAKREDIVYYTTTSLELLSELFLQSAIDKKPEQWNLAVSLFDYLVNVNDRMPDYKFGILGFVDDAWLINNAILKLLTEKHKKVSNANWDRIYTANQIVKKIMPGNVFESLQRQLLNSISDSRSPLNISDIAEVNRPTR